MQIEFFTNFRKRENSCKIPTGPAAATLTGFLREPASIESPVFTIKRLASDDPPDVYVYASIPRFGRYYFVTGWAWAEGVWECQLQEDYLASWRTYIGSTSAYIERAASESDGSIIDRTYPATTDFGIEYVAVQSAYHGKAPSGGCYVLGIINNANFGTAQAGGAVTYYAMTVAQMRSLMHYLLSGSFLTDAGFPVTPTAAQQLMQDTAKAFINPAQYIVSCIWFPVTVQEIADTNASPIVLGYWDLDSNVATGHKLTAFAYTTYLTATIPDHPQKATRGKYLNYAPYTRLTLNAPPFGSIPLDTSFCETGNYLRAEIFVDTITGKAQMQVKIQPSSSQFTSEAIVAEANAMMGIPIQISQLTPDYFSAFSSIMGGASTFAGAIGGGVTNAAVMAIPSVGNVIDSLMPQERVSGVNGSFITYIINPVLTVQHIKIVDEDNTELGRPLCAVRTINTLSGFIKCGEATVDYPCFASEKTKIHNYLLTGFFWE